jgi:hypothetical protein
MIGSAVLIPLAGVTVLGVNPAAAKVTGITCTKLSGSANTSTGVVKTKVTGCTGNTGGTGKSKGTVSDTSSTIKWANGKSTNYSVNATAGSGCTQAGALTEVESGTVNTDTTGSTTVGAAVSATVCVVQSATNPDVVKISLLPGTKWVIAK